MKDPMRIIDRFCYKHPNFGIPNLMKYIAIGSCDRIATVHVMVLD